MSERTGCPGASANLGIDRAAAIGEQPAISGPPIGDPGDSPIRGLGDFSSAEADPLMRKRACRGVASANARARIGVSFSGCFRKVSWMRPFGVPGAPGWGGEADDDDVLAGNRPRH